MSADIAPTNAQTIVRIPATHITPVEREFYLTRAEAGLDVYAYSKPGYTQPDIWDIWDTDTRIVMPLLSKRWYILRMALVEGDTWSVDVLRGTERHTLTMHIEPSIHYPRSSYAERAQRVIISQVNHIAQFDGDIRALDGAHH